jgi:hypothetical protein
MEVVQLLGKPVRKKVKPVRVLGKTVRKKLKPVRVLGKVVRKKVKPVRVYPKVVRVLGVYCPFIDGNVGICQLVGVFGLAVRTC